MRKILVLLIIFVCIGLQALAVKAFPTAEGYGAINNIGGRGGTLIKVTNLNDSGAGSFREALFTTGPRIIVFTVSGTITLLSNLEPSGESLSYVTIAGQTSPGGIQFRNYGFIFHAGIHDVIIRHIRVRPGNAASPPSAPYQGDIDGIEIWGASATPVYDIILDHVSAGWAVDENLTVTGPVTDTTIQWSMAYEGGTTGHYYGTTHSVGIFSDAGGGTRINYHHNLLAHNDIRNPSFQRGIVDFRNNVVYNWGSNNYAYTTNGYYNGQPTWVNFVKNVYRSCSTGGANWRGSICGAGDEHMMIVRESTAVCQGATQTLTKVYYKQNMGPGSLVAKDWADLPPLDECNFLAAAPSVTYESATPVLTEPVVTEHAPTGLWAAIKDTVGAYKPSRDALDTRIIDETEALTGVIGPGADGNTYTYPTLTGGAAPTDTDGDGMSDTWETANGLNPNSSADGNATATNGWTNIENYINDLAGDNVGGGADVTGPVLSSIASSGITTTSAVITWNTNEASDSQINYGLTASYGSSSTLNETDVINHSQTLSGLTIGTLYHYRVLSRDAAGNLTTGSDNTFTTVSGGTPAVTLVSEVTSVLSTIGTSVCVSANASAGQLALASTHLYHGSNSTGASPTGILYGTTPMVRVGGIGTSGEGENTSVWKLYNPPTGAQNVCATFGLSTRPVLTVTLYGNANSSNPTGTPVLSIPDATGTSSSLTVPSAANGMVHDAITVSPSSGASNAVITVGAGQTERWNVLFNGGYHVDAGSTEPGAANVTMSHAWTDGTHRFSHIAVPINAVQGGDPPTITNISAGLPGTTSATITWTTDQLSDSQVDYGLTVAYGSSSTLDETDVTSHSVALSGLTNGANYHFRVKSRNADGLITVSDDSTFLVTPVAPVISGITANPTSTTSVVTWITDLASDSQVEYGLTASYGSKTTLNGADNTNHTETITGLAASTLYHYRVKSRSIPGGVLTTSADGTFTTQAAAAATPGANNLRLR